MLRHSSSSFAAAATVARERLQSALASSAPPLREHMSAYVSICQHLSAYVTPAATVARERLRAVQASFAYFRFKLRM